MTYDISNWYKKQKLIHPWFFFEPVSNNGNSSSSFNTVLIGYFDNLIFWYLIKFPQFEFPRWTQAFFSSYFFSALKPKSDLIDKIFIKNQAAMKINQLTDL